MRQARGRSPVRPSDTAGIEEQHITASFIPRDVCVAVQQNIYICRWLARRDVNQAKANTISFHIHSERPLQIAVAITTHDQRWRPQRLDCFEQMWRADIAEMPDLVSPGSQRVEFRRQVVVRVCKDQDAQRSSHCVIAQQRSLGRRQRTSTVIGNQWFTM